MATTRISTVIPTYNRSGLVISAVESVISHGHNVYEIIVVDDGSTDDTRIQLNRFLGDARLKYVYQNNSGKPSVARNTGIAHASGEYIRFLDSDDLLIDGSVEKMQKVLDENKDVAMVFGDWMEMSFVNGQRVNAPSWVANQCFLADIPHDFIEQTDNGLTKFNQEIVNAIFTKVFVFTSSVMVRKSILEKIGCFDETLTISEDRDLWLRICSNYPTAYINEPLSYKRRHANNITNYDLSFDFKQDREAIEKFLQRSNILNGPYQRLAREQVGEFYKMIGKYFWHRGELDDARYCLGKALQNGSGEAKSLLCFLSTFLPCRVIAAARALKSVFRPVLTTSDVP